MVKFKKREIKVCPLKSTLVADILSQKNGELYRFAKRRSFFANLLKSSLDDLSKIHLLTNSRRCIRRRLLSKKQLNTIKKRIYVRKKSRLFLKKRVYKKLKKVFASKRYNKKNLRLPVEGANSLFYFKLTILFKKNNIFCNFSDFINNKTLNSCSSGKYKIKVAKKTLKYTHDLVLDQFYREIWQKVYTKIKKKENNKKGKMPRKGLFVNIVCSTRLRKKVCKYIFRKFKKIPLMMNSISKKVFNGCRPPKKVRKKRRKMRIYK